MDGLERMLRDEREALDFLLSQERFEPMDETHNPDNPWCDCFSCHVDMAEAGILEPVVIEVDEIIHDPVFRPFCSDMTCPCHEDAQLVIEQLDVPHELGLLTADEGFRLYTGRQL